MASISSSEDENKEQLPPNLVWRFAIAVMHKVIKFSSTQVAGKSALSMLDESSHVHTICYVDFQHALYHHFSDNPCNYIDHLGTFRVSKNKLLLEVHFNSLDQIKLFIDGLDTMIIERVVRNSLQTFIKSSFHELEFEVALVIQSNIEPQLRLVTRENAAYAFSIVYTKKPAVTLFHIQNPEIYGPIKKAYMQLLQYFPDFFGELGPVFDSTGISTDELECDHMHEAFIDESKVHAMPRSESVVVELDEVKLEKSTEVKNPESVTPPTNNKVEGLAEHSPSIIGAGSDKQLNKKPVCKNSPSDINYLDEEVSNEEIGKIAAEIPPHLYKYLGNRLGLDSHTVDRIEYDNRGSSLNFILGILNQAKLLEDTSKRTFVTALLHCKLWKAAKMLDNSLDIPNPETEASLPSPLESLFLIDVDGQLYFYDEQLAKDHLEKQQSILFWKRFQRELHLAVSDTLKEYGINIHSTSEGSLIVRFKLKSYNQAKRVSIDVATGKMKQIVEDRIKVFGFTGILAVEFKIGENVAIPEQCYQLYVQSLLSKKAFSFPVGTVVKHSSRTFYLHQAKKSITLERLAQHSSVSEIKQPPEQDSVHCEKGNNSSSTASVTSEKATSLSNMILYGTLEQLQRAASVRGAVNKYTDKFLPLHLAAHHGKSEKIKILMEHGADLEAKAKTEERVTALHLAAYSGHLKAVQILVDLGAAIEASSASGLTPLHLAVTQKNFSVAKFLLEKGANCNSISKNKTTPLYCAVSEGHQGIIKLLLHNGADMTLGTIEGETPIHHAVVNGNGEVLKLLISANPQAITHPNVNKFEPPLITAVKLQKVPIIKTLLCANCDPNVCNKDYMSPLAVASCMENLEIMELLVSYGANMMLSFPPHGTPLHISAVEGKVNAARKLLKMEIDPNVLDSEGTTPLRRAVENQRVEVAAVLLKHGADMHIECPGDEMSLLHKAAKRNDVKMLKLLIERGGDPYERGIKGGTAMFTAAASGSGDAVDLLSKYPGLIDIANKQHFTPLMAAIYNRKYDCALRILKHKPNVSKCNWDNMTILYICIDFRAPQEVIEGILACDSTIDTPGPNGISPILLACHRGFTELVKAMLKKNIYFLERHPEISSTLVYAAIDAGSFGSLEALLQHGANPNCLHPHMPMAPLHYLCSQHIMAEKMFQVLLDHNPDVNFVTDIGAPLHISVVNQKNRFVAMLLRHNADPNVVSGPDKASPLITAAEVNNVEAASLILQHGGRIDYALTSNGFTSLHKAAISNLTDMAELLIKAIVDRGANIDQPSNEGYSALHLAVSAGSQEVFGLLIENNCNMNAQDNEGGTPLMRAIHDGKNDMALMLLELGANIQIRDANGLHALHLGARFGSTEVVTRLLELGTSPDIQERNGVTPLFLSLLTGQLQTATILIQKGANVNLADNKGNTPLHIAAESNNSEAVRLLLENGANPVNKNTKGKSPGDLTESKNIVKILDVTEKRRHKTSKLILKEEDYKLAGEENTTYMTSEDACVKNKWLDLQSTVTEKKKENS